MMVVMMVVMMIIVVVIVMGLVSISLVVRGMGGGLVVISIGTVMIIVMIIVVIIVMIIVMTIGMSGSASVRSVKLSTVMTTNTGGCVWSAHTVLVKRVW